MSKLEVGSPQVHCVYIKVIVTNILANHVASVMFFCVKGKAQTHRANRDRYKVR